VPGTKEALASEVNTTLSTLSVIERAGSARFPPRREHFDGETLNVGHTAHQGVVLEGTKTDYGQPSRGSDSCWMSDEISFASSGAESDLSDNLPP
jgi:hypothetical protein